MTTTRITSLFYFVVLGVALTGAGQAAAGWLGWWPPFAFAAVAAVELGGVALSAHADERRRVGERAVGARLLSGAVAVGAILVNFFGHADQVGQAYFFAGMSGLGYSVWLIHSGARRRDQLRRVGKLGDTAPVYGLLAWLRHPALTLRARGLALANPTLGKVGSLASARAEVRREVRTSAIAKVLHRKIRASVDPATADIATAVYDLDEIAERLRVGADYNGLTALIAADLVPARLAPATTARARIVEVERERIPAELEAVEVPAAESVNVEVSAPAEEAAVPEIAAAPEAAPQAPERPARRPKKASGTSVPRRTAIATQQAAQTLANTGMNTQEVAQLLGISERYARQLLGSRELPAAAAGPATGHDGQADDVDRINGAEVELTGVTR
ncbi:hypothetical protein [Dactylosporangium sp. NPDC006015]|uniref:hypothetical protein n=1 Tax=Dactylosporangium sp. NPDC006015 TaxID=3154576 RepID=UPI0033A5B595